MPYDRSTNYEMIYVFLAVLVICCLTILGPWVIQPKMQEISRDLTLQSLETAYKAIQPPAQTEPMASQAVFWNDTANKKGCNFFVGEIRTYRGKQAEILSAYAAQRVADASPIQVVFIENSTLPADENSQIPLSLRALQAWALPPGAAEQALYLVYIFKSDQTLACP
jgi:hypothetical protein